MKKIFLAIIAMALFSLPVSAFAQTNQTTDITTLLETYGKLKKQHDDLLVSYGSEKKRADEAVKEANELRKQVEVLVFQVGQLKKELEIEKEKAVKLKNISSSVSDDATAGPIWTRTLESAYEKIAALEDEVKRLKGQMVNGEEKIVEKLTDAGVPPIYFTVADCGEGDWDCKKWQKSTDKAMPSREHYSSLLIIPSFSFRGLEAGFSETAQAKLARKRGEAVARYYAGLGFQVSVGQAIEGGSRVLMMFVSSAMPSYKMAELEKVAYENAGAIRAIVERVEALENKVGDHEKRITSLEKSGRVKFQVGVLGSFSLAGKDEAAGAGLLDLSLQFPIIDEWVLVLVGQGGVGNVPGESMRAAPYHFGGFVGFTGKYGGRALIGAKSVGMRGHANQSLAEGCLGEFRADMSILNFESLAFFLTVEIGFGPVWRQGELTSIFQAVMGLGLGF